MPETNSDLILLERFDRQAVVRFNRPASKNPLSVAALERLKRVFSDLESNADISKIVFAGSGDAFASGANLREIAQVNEHTARAFARRGQTLMQKIYRSEKATVAAVDGFCMGGAFDLALSCKTRIASPGSIFAHPGANLGIMTGWSGTQLLPRLVGEAKALEIFLTAERLDAAEALRIGLIDAISPDPVEYALGFAA